MLKRELEESLEVIYPSDKSKNWTDKVSGKLISMELRESLVKRLRNGSPQAWEITEKGVQYLIDKQPDTLKRIEKENQKYYPSLSRDNSYFDAQVIKEIDEYEPSNPEEARQYVNRAILMRRGQSAFREKLLRKYGCCLITGCDAKEALEAAHIKAFASGGRNHLSNGLLLRADIHTLFDLGRISIDPESWTVKICTSLKVTAYKELSGKKVISSNILAQALDRDAQKTLLRHCENVSGKENV